MPPPSCTPRCSSCSALALRREPGDGALDSAVCTVLDLEPVLEHVVAHLPSARDRGHLRRTCRALRASEAILLSRTNIYVDCAKLVPAQLAFLSRLTGVSRATLRCPPNFSQLGAVLALPRLAHVSVSEGISSYLDLAELRQVRGLTELHLHLIIHYSDFSSLTGLSCLKLHSVTWCPGLHRLTGLQRLTTCLPEHASSVGALTRLSRLSLAVAPDQPAFDLTALRALPELRVLKLGQSVGYDCLADVAHLTRLTALRLRSGLRCIDLSALADLRRLWLNTDSGYVGEIRAPSVSALTLEYVAYSGDERFCLPRLVAMSGLQQLNFVLDMVATVTVDPDLLPHHGACLSLQGGHGGLLLKAETSLLRRVLQFQRVARLSLLRDPVPLG